MEYSSRSLNSAYPHTIVISIGVGVGRYLVHLRRLGGEAAAAAEMEDWEESTDSILAQRKASVKQREVHTAKLQFTIH
jgi:hypothetical protein